VEAKPPIQILGGIFDELAIPAHDFFRLIDRPNDRATINSIHQVCLEKE